MRVLPGPLLPTIQLLHSERAGQNATQTRWSISFRPGNCQRYAEVVELSTFVQLRLQRV
jgi:hypothetical protein